MYYFIGIKGSGMASLALILYDLGYEVAGSDIDKYIFIEEDLRKKGIECYYTIDAGPNVKILCTLRNRKEIISAVQKTLSNVKIVVASFGPGVTLL